MSLMGADPHIPNEVHKITTCDIGQLRDARPPRIASAKTKRQERVLHVKRPAPHGGEFSPATHERPASARLGLTASVKATAAIRIPVCASPSSVRTAGRLKITNANSVPCASSSPS